MKISLRSTVKPRSANFNLFDNLGANTLSHDATYHIRTMKNINVSYYFICKKVASNKVVLTYVRSKDNLADLMTKSLDLTQHHHLHEKLGYLEEPN